MTDDNQYPRVNIGTLVDYSPSCVYIERDVSILFQNQWLSDM